MIILLAKLAIYLLQARNEFLTKEIEAQIKVNEEHESRLLELQKLNKEYDSRLLELGTKSIETYQDIMKLQDKIEDWKQLQSKLDASKVLRMEL